MKIYTFLMLAAMAFSTATVSAQAIGTDCNAPSVDFTGFMGAGVSSGPAAGELNSDDWAFTGFSTGPGYTPGPANFGVDYNGFIDYHRDDTNGGVTTGGLYSLDINGGQALWIQPAGSDFTPGNITLKSCNNSGAAIADLYVAYDLLYLNDQDRAVSMEFSYSTDNTSYTDVPGLAFSTPEGSAPSPVATLPRTATLSGVNVADGACAYLRWTVDDAGGSGSRDEIGLDNIFICDAAASPPPMTAAVPTMGQWAMFLFTLIMVSFGLVFVYKAQARMALANGVSVSADNKMMPFDQATFQGALKLAVALAIPGFALIYMVWGEIVSADFIGMALAIPAVAYLIHMVKLFDKK